MRRLIQSASQTPAEALSKAHRNSAMRMQRNWEGVGGKGEFCGKVRDSKQGLPRSKTRVT